LIYAGLISSSVKFPEDKDKELACDTPLISGGYDDSFSVVAFIENKFKKNAPRQGSTGGI